MTPQTEPLKNLFTFEKFQQTLAFYWSYTWRFWFSLLMICLVFGPFVGFAEFHLENLSSFSGKPILLGVLIIMILSHRILISNMFLELITSKDYKSFDKLFLNEKFSKFWSWGFWKVLLKFWLFSFVFSVLELFVLYPWLDKFMIEFSVDNLYLRFFLEAVLSVVLYVTFFNIIFHKGLLGFIPVSKGLKNDE